MIGQDKRAICCLCCKRGTVSLRTQLERTAYVCGESIRLKADIDNQCEEEIKLKLKLVQVSLSSKKIHVLFSYFLSDFSSPVCFICFITHNVMKTNIGF